MPLTDAERTLLSSAPSVRAFIQSRTPKGMAREFEVDDLLHEVWARVLQATSEETIATMPNLEGYLKRVATTVVLDRVRKRHTQKRGGGANSVKTINANDLRSSYTNLFERIAGPRKTPSSEVATNEAISAVQSALERIPEKQREAIMLFHISGMSYAEIGDQLQRSPRAVQGLLTRGLSNLRTKLGPAVHYLSDVDSQTE